MSDADPTSDVSTLTVQLLSAYLANNTVPSEQLAELIRSTKAALTDETSVSAQPAAPQQVTPAVSVRKSLASPEHIISLVDGKPYKTLKRHLASHGLTPETYRSRYSLPASYPMVAPAYAEHRREVAQRLGLGRREPKAEQPQGSAPQEPSIAEALLPQTALSPAKARLKGGARKTSKAAADKQDTSLDIATAVVLSNDDAATASDVTLPEASATPAGEVTAGEVTGAAPGPKARSRKTSKRAEATPVKPEAKMSDASDRAGENGGEGQARKRKVTKRLGKIGLSEKADAPLPAGSDGGGTNASSLPAPGTNSDDQAEMDVEAPTKKRPAKRMARTPKPEAS